MKAVRLVGQGDLGHVRGQLLSVGICIRNSLPAQFLGALCAAEELKMRFRAYVVGNMNDHVELTYLMQRYQAAEAQLVMCSKFPPDTIDILLQPEAGEIISEEEAKRVIINTWNMHGGRFAGGNFGHHDAATLTRMYLTNANSQ